jgi:tetratricopeptide (TPR) repeat protein
MKRLAIAALLVATRASADTVDEHLAKVRELYDKGDFVHARDELLAAYQLDARPELLFALGQVELNLGHFEKAIDYYQQFIATNPGSDQAALAQQAIGAARARLTEKPPVVAPPPPPPHRAWDIEDTGIAALGGTTLLVGAGLFAYGHHLAIDRSGTLSEYNDRLSQATLTQWIGAGCVAAGAIAIGGAILRWRLHLVETEIQPIAAPKTAGVSWVGRW